MAERKFFIVPTDPFFKPTIESAKKAQEFFAIVTPFPNANGEYDFRTFNKPILIDSGEGLEGVICPACDKENNSYKDEQSEEWWENIDIYSVTNINSTTKMPCCQNKVKFKDLKFISECYFASFVMGSLEPSTSEHWEDDEESLKESTIKEFENILGSKVHQYWSYG